MALPPDRRRLRASDADRDRVVEALRRHGALGRLTLEETTERIGQALEARTLGQLQDLLGDLPEESSAALPAPPAGPPLWRSPSLWARAGELAVIDLICVALWVLEGARGTFWPLWVVFLSVIVMARKVTKVAEREERRRRRAVKRSPVPPWQGPS